MFHVEHNRTTLEHNKLRKYTYPLALRSLRSKVRYGIVYYSQRPIVNMRMNTMALHYSNE